VLRLSKKLLFALEAVVDVAYHAGHRPVRSSDISDRQGIPRRYLEQVLQELVHEGILAGQRGPRGGYRLARDGASITLGQIIRIVRRLEGLSEPAAEPGGSRLGTLVVRPIWHEMQEEMMARLDRLTVAELCQRARALGVETS
jgi:Rrf2 family protein